jgi:hypothetical protein
MLNIVKISFIILFSLFFLNFVKEINAQDDKTPPASINDLIAYRTYLPSCDRMILEWTAPGDDGTTGRASGYDIRYSTSPITTETSWNSAIQATGEPIPSVAGTRESFIVTGLLNNTTYYFAIKTKDEADNWSGLSNNPSNSTLPAVTAASGYISDIQAAVNNVASGGCVYIPAGNFTDNYNIDNFVSIPGGVSVFGSGYIGEPGKGTGKWNTVLKMSGINWPTSWPKDGTCMFRIDYETQSNKPSRISGIAFEGFREPSPPFRGYDGICIGNTPSISVRDFRIDHCYFSDFGYDGIAIGGYYSRGVVDHCEFWNIMKGTTFSNTIHIGYGVGYDADYSFNGWISDIRPKLGSYEDGVIYVEDSYFDGVRHGTVAFAKARIVTRHCIFDRMHIMYQSGYTDCHGAYPDSYGGRYVEVYDNEFHFRVDDSVPWQDPDIPKATMMRGGGGVFTNNKVYDINVAVEIADDEGNAAHPENYVNQFWVWNNTLGSGVQLIDNTNSHVRDGTAYTFDQCEANGWHCYYLRAPNMAQDGFVYQKYPYPHWLTLEGEAASITTYPVNITGIVTDSSTGLPIQGALVSCNSFTDSTNSTGGYFIRMTSNPGSCMLTASKTGYQTYSSSLNFPTDGTYTRNIALVPVQTPRNRIHGRLLDNSSQPLNGRVIIYQGITIVNSTWTSNGNYDLSVSSGIYDIQFNISDFYIKLLSVNISSDIKDIINYIDHRNRISFISSTDLQEFQILSPNPDRVLLNGSEIAVNTSLNNNTYYYLNGVVYLKVTPDLKSDCIYTCCKNEARYRDKNCSTSEYCSNRVCYPKQNCPYECCMNEEQYLDKVCPSGYICDSNHNCIIGEKTFGKTTIGPNNNVFYGDEKDCSRFRLTENGNVTKMSIYIHSSSGNINLRAGIYSDSNGNPNILRGQSGQLSVGTTWNWYNFTFSPPISLNAGYYWLCFLSSGQGQCKTSATSSNQYVYNSDVYSDGFSSTFGTTNFEQLEMSIFATYTPT